MFREAAAMGASAIRLDIALAGVFPTPHGPPDWRGVDEYVSLARRYRLSVLANLVAPPWYMLDGACGDYHCAPRDPDWWGRLAGLLASHTRGAIDDFEIVNEPDGRWAFRGTPQQYARMLAASYTAIHRANPNADVALGGLMRTGAVGNAWIEQMLRTPAANAIHKFDIANIHIRGRAADAGAIVSAWRRYFAAKGFAGALWVTETGYPADPAWQTDPAHRGGADAQVRWLEAAIPAMFRAGASKVFITERDSLTGQFRSEGLLDSRDPLTADPQYTRRSSFYAVRRLATHTSVGATSATILGSSDVRSGKIIVRLACDGAAGQSCRGRATLSTRSSGTLGSARFTARAGTTTRIPIKLSRAGEKLIASLKRMPVRLIVILWRSDGTLPIQARAITLSARES